MKGTSAGHLGRKLTTQSPCTSHLLSPDRSNKPVSPKLSCSGLALALPLIPGRIQPALPWHLHQLSTLQRSLELSLSRPNKDSITQPALPGNTPKAASQTDSCPGRKYKGHSSQHRVAKPIYCLHFSGCQRTVIFFDHLCSKWKSSGTDFIPQVPASVVSEF